MRYKIIALILSIVSSSCLIIAQPTFSKDIAPIIYNQCTVCHRSGEIGPMSFTSYDEVKNWASTIKYVTSIKYMPPWKADPEYSNFLGENYLTDEQIELIKQWADAGAPQGDVSDEPPLPDFPSGSLLGEPDLVLEMEEAWLHRGDNKDEYRYFVIPTGLTEDKVVKAIELRPGNPKIVHHCLFFEDITGEAAANDAATPEYGFDGFGSFTSDQTAVLTAKQYQGYVPGQKPRFYQDGVGQVLSAGSDLVLQMHYAPWSVDELDKSTINIFFADENEDVERYVESHIMVPLGNVLINGPFFIPANQTRSFHGIWDVPSDLSLVGIAPHMHLLGTDWTVYLESPDGTITNLISIPDWDFNWQGYYNFNRYIKAEQGSKIHAIASYDNTSENPNNPNNPPQWTSWGEGTEDEMYYLPILYIPYQNGDEDIIFEDVSTSIDHVAFDEDNDLALLPNPADERTRLEFDLRRGQSISVGIYDIHGKLVRMVRNNEFFPKGKNIVNLAISSLEKGIYSVSLITKDYIRSQQLVKN